MGRQIDCAQAHNNHHRVAGLQEKFRQVGGHCTDNQLLRQKETKVAEKQRKATKRQQELEQIRASGNRKKSRISRQNWMKPRKNWQRLAVNFATVQYSNKISFN
ncbi:DUF1090 domain-containing protein [Salmonella enterica]|nr:DUF1090 domain-containing protein [Salmonella enterica subsp. enterica]ELC5005102.1 DUF1090 domain-containing protein [Salmonella enterica]